MKMGIEELARAHIGDNSTTAITSDVETPTIKLRRLERNFLITAANPYYEGAYTAHVMDILDIDKKEKVYRLSQRYIKRKLDISSDYNVIFTAVCIVLKDRLISIDEILDGKDLAEELPRFKAALRKLSGPQKRILTECYNQAADTHYVSMTEVAESMHYASSGSPLLWGKGHSAYKKLGISNHAQLAFFAHVYMHFMHNPVEEQLTEKQLDALEAIVIKGDTKWMYKAEQDGASNTSIRSPLAYIRDTFHVETSMEAVLKALDLGFYTLLLEADIPAFFALDPAQMNFLKDASNPVVLNEDQYTKSRIYRRLGIRSRAQLAPYLFLAAKLDENEMGSLRSANASPDGDPMKIIYKKFGIPEGAALLAPSKYLAVKREMAVKN